MSSKFPSVLKAYFFEFYLKKGIKKQKKLTFNINSHKELIYFIYLNHVSENLTLAEQLVFYVSVSQFNRSN